jgi:5-(carboxyamino)imidazole ribonucleotide synthase
MRLGILGGGQLGRMLALAGSPLGVRCLFKDPAAETPARLLAEQIVADYDDEEALDRLADRVDLVTYEFENVPVEALYHLAERRSVFPAPQALKTMQDRSKEKRLCELLGIPVPPFRSINTVEQLQTAAEEIGVPAMLKTRYSGYDGRGQRRVERRSELEPAFEALGGRLLIFEPLVPFDRELSLIAVRARDGAFTAYPLIENHHRDGILCWSRSPAPVVPPAQQARAEAYARRVMEHFGYVGAMTLEFFDVGGHLLVNEMAPRVHNSGHWTIEGAVTSQFENHLRAGLGWPLGSTRPRGHCLMMNLLGTLPDLTPILAIADAHLHLYGKAARPRRKLGHVTIVAGSAGQLEAARAQLSASLEPLANYRIITSNRSAETFDGQEPHDIP